jgi:hypothetical protein
MSNKNYSNLKPWKPGQSGNPAGRKAGSKNVSSIVKQLLDQDANTNLLDTANITELANGKPTTYAQAIVFAMLKKASEGNVQAVHWLTEQQERNYASENARGLFHSDHLIIEVIPNKSTLA